MRPLRLAGFVAKARASHYAGWTPTAVWALIVLFAAAAYGLGAVLLLDQLAEGIAGAGEVRLVGRIFFLGAAVLAGASHYVPSFRPPSPALPAYLPGGALTRSLFGVLFDGLSLPWMAASVYVVVTALSPQLGFVAFAAGMAAVVAVFAVDRSVRLLLEYRPPSRILHVAALAIWAAGLVWTATTTGPWFPGAGTAVAAAALFHHLLLARYTAAVSRRRQGRGEEAVARGIRAGEGLPELVRSTLIGAPRYLVSLGVGLVMKAVALFVLGLIARDEGGTDPFLRVVFLAVASPVVVFSYAMNNAFGHVPELFDTLHLHAPDFATLFRSYLHLLQPPLVADLAVALVTSAYAGQLDAGFLGVYLAAAALLTPLGLWGSLLAARPVSRKQFLRLRNSTSTLFSVGCSGSVIVALALASLSRHALSLLLAAGVVAGGLFVVTFELGERRRTRVGRRVYAALSE